MIKKYHKWRDRREASGIKPLLFLLLEFLLIGLASVLVFFIAPIWVSGIVTVALLYFFMTNCLRRYNKIKERQQFYDKR